VQEIFFLMEKFESMKLEDLRRRLEELGLSTKGTKSVLRQRLATAFRDESSKDDKENTCGNQMYSESVSKTKTPKMTTPKTTIPKMTMPKMMTMPTMSRTMTSKMITPKTTKQNDITDDVENNKTKDDDDNDIESDDEDDDIKSDDDNNEIESDGEDDNNSTSVSDDSGSDTEVAVPIKTLKNESRQMQTNKRSNSDFETKTRRRYRGKSSKLSLTFKDVEESMESFSGDGNENVVNWIKNFEEVAELCDWSDVQKVMYGRRLLRGSAKLFMQFECSTKTWIKMKRELKKEFAKTANSKQIHRKLATMKKKQDESYTEYTYRMLEIASHVEMEIGSKIQYIIDGIPDDEVNKTVLYGAKTIKDLRKRLPIYEAQKLAATKSHKKHSAVSEKTKRMNQTQVTQQQTKRCFNCGVTNHVSAQCPDKTKGTKCFKCGNFGHIASKCTDGVSEDSKSKPRCDLVATGDKKTYKKVKILDQDIIAVLDPGSDLHLVCAMLYVKLGAPKLQPV